MKDWPPKTDEEAILRLIDDGIRGMPEPERGLVYECRDHLRLLVERYSGSILNIAYGMIAAEWAEQAKNENSATR